MEVVVTIPLDMRVVIPGSRMNLPPLCWPIRCEFPQCIGVGGHVDRNIFGRDLLSLVVGDEEGDVRGALIELKEVGDERRTVACLYPDRVHLPRVVESNRAFFCISHTSSTFSASFMVSAMRTHPFSLRLGRYFCGIWVVLFVAVVIADVVPHEGSNTCFMGFSCMLEDVVGNVFAVWRRDKDNMMLVVMTVFCGTVVGAKHVRYVADSCDTDQG